MTKESVRKAGGAVIGLGLATLQSSAVSEEVKPNILFVMVDDLPPDAVFQEGRYPFLHVPHIDRLAEEGMVFDQMFVTTSICSPSRASILTGTYASVHGVRYNEISDPDPTLPQFPQILQQHGYKTAMIGKWHMDHHARPRPGFDYWISFKGQGVYTDPELNENGREFKAEGYITDILTQKTLDFLTREPDSPFVVLLWHKANHAPFEPAPRHANAFRQGRIAEPVSWAIDMAEKPTWQRRQEAFGPHYRAWVASEDKPVPERIEIPKWNPGNQQRLNMIRCMLAVDEGLGEVMALLEEQGRMDNTIIIFMADNGWFMGEHRRSDKRMAYEEGIRVPFAIRYPAKVKPGRRTKALAANIDIGPTLLELAGATVPKAMQGESFVPVLEGQATEHRQVFFYEYFQEHYAPGIPTMLAIRTPEWKYITYPYESAEEGNFDELYHLENDPHEMRNLIHSPEASAQLKKMKTLLENAKEQYGSAEPPYKYEPPKKETL